MPRTARANSAPPIITAAASGKAKFPPAGPHPGTTTLTTPQPPSVDMAILEHHLADTEDRLAHALAQLTATQAALTELQSGPRPVPRPTNEQDALIRRLTRELARKEAHNQALRRELVVAEQKLDAAFASHDEYRMAGTRELNRLLRDRADLEGRVGKLVENRELRGEEGMEEEVDGEGDSMFDEVEGMF